MDSPEYKKDCLFLEKYGSRNMNISDVEILVTDCPLGLSVKFKNKIWIIKLKQGTVPRKNYVIY